MSTIVNTGLITDLQQFGAAEINACYSCGNCTAICPLSDNDATFPRRFIRLAQVGLEDDLVASKELWTCYQCGMCTEKCPTEADPAEFMATARRFAIAHYDRTGLAKVLYTKPALSWVIAAALAVFLGAFMLTASGQMSAISLDLFGFVPYPFIHWLGIGVMAIVVITSLLGAVSLAHDMAKRDGVTWKSLLGSGEGRKGALHALWYSIGIESIGQKRYREDCRDDEPIEPLYRRRWLIHALTIWGFIGLLLATGIDYGLDVLDIKPTGTPVAIYYPTRLLGTVAGLSMVYGVSMFMWNRWRRATIPSRTTLASDWLFLWLLWLTGVSGFVIEVALYAPPTPVWGYWVFIAHIAIAMDLLLLVPFTKFAHVMYRPIALFFYGLARQGQ